MYEETSMILNSTRVVAPTQATASATLVGSKPSTVCFFVRFALERVVFFLVWEFLVAMP